MGLKVSDPVKIFCDNKGIVLNSTIPQSTMKKKTIALAHHFVWEHQANGVIDINFIDTGENYADAFMKAVDSNACNDFFYKIMSN